MYNSGYPQYPAYFADDTYLRPHPVVPSPLPSPHGSPNRAPMYLDENYNYYQPGSNYVGVPMFPASFVPLPPSPSMLAATFVPLPPSPRVSPRMGPIPLSPGGQMYPHHYQHYMPIDPWYAPQAGPMYMNPSYTPRSYIHPLLKDSPGYLHLDLTSPAYSPLTPSSSSHSSFSLARSSLISVHTGYLEQVATYPAVTKITLACAALSPFAEQWTITVRAPRDANGEPTRNVVVGDVLRAVHAALQTPVTHMEWARMTEREVYDASKAYTRRCRTAEFERMQGVRRVDLLGEKHWFGGIVRAKEDDPYSFKLLVRSKPT